MGQLRGLLAILAALSLGAAVPAEATPTLSGFFNVHDHVGPNSVGSGVGERLNFGVGSVVPAGPDTTASAVQAPHNLALFRIPVSLLPGLYNRTLACSPCPTGSWAISATDGIGPAAVGSTNSIPDPQLLPLVLDLHVDGSTLTPTVHWTLPDLSGFDVDNIRVRIWHDDVDVGVFLGAAQVATINDLFFQSGLLPPDTTQYTVPEGVLEKHRPYIFEVLLQDTETIQGITFTENRSRTFTQVPFEVPGPASLIALGAGVLLVTAVRRRSSARP